MKGKSVRGKKGMHRRKERIVKDRNEKERWKRKGHGIGVERNQLKNA